MYKLLLKLDMPVLKSDSHLVKTIKKKNIKTNRILL